MDFLTPEQEMWRETVFRFMEEEIGRDYVREKDRNREYPYEGYAKIVAQGWIGLLVPEEQGGQGGDVFSYALMCEGLARYGPDFATALMVPMFTAQNIVRHGTPGAGRALYRAVPGGRDALRHIALGAAGRIRRRQCPHPRPAGRR